MTDRLTPDQEAEARRLALWTEESAVRVALRAVIEELDAVRVDLKEAKDRARLLDDGHGTMENLGRDDDYHEMGH